VTADDKTGGARHRPLPGAPGAVVDVRRGSRKDKEAKAMKRKIRKKR
jgi:hypothetical protein